VPSPNATVFPDPSIWDVVIIGGGLAGLSAAVYLGRALRKTLLLDSGKSLAVWEPDVQNYLGFPEGIDGKKLLSLGRQQALKYGARCQDGEVVGAHREQSLFCFETREALFRSRCALLATGLIHLPPEIPKVKECLGHSMFFCKDCDAFRVRGQRIVIVGSNDEAVDYALAILSFSPIVVLAPNGVQPRWSSQHADWIREYQIPVYSERIVEVEHDRGFLQSLTFADGQCVAADCLFTTRGDRYHNKLAQSLGAALDESGEVKVDAEMRTSVPGLYAAGCVTPANCQMIIAAGNGATAAQTINRDLFEESLRTHTLRRFREMQIASEPTEPEEISAPAKQ
jgi:thioredoxin reductase (NADPH)